MCFIQVQVLHVDPDMAGSALHFCNLPFIAIWEHLRFDCKKYWEDNTNTNDLPVTLHCG